MASLAGNNLCTPIMPCKKSRLSRQSLQVRAQSYRDDQGKSSNNTFDTNLRVLRERIEKVKMKERLERCCLLSDQHHHQGWNYAPLELSIKAKRDEQLLQFLQLVGMFGANLGLTILTCSFLLCTVISLLLHLNQ